ncbi:unnamed protein product [Linum tenue]|uniref:Uncharacterized protein n=1 Tax=Linum tenue TaxID=586396 RepID=A0AAV0H8C2_9ROSI|nr:unnamed protein product [Linum tenue]
MFSMGFGFGRGENGEGKPCHRRVWVEVGREHKDQEGRRRHRLLGFMSRQIYVRSLITRLMWD